jgi:sortase A
MTAGTARSRARAVLRFIAAVLATTGALLLADVAMTLLWQEPVSALVAARGQHELEEQLATASRRFERAAQPASASRSRARLDLARASRAYAAELRTGRAFGRTEMPTLKRSFVVAQGTDAATLRKGPGHYPRTRLPGQRGTVAFAGHRTTYGRRSPTSTTCGGETESWSRCRMGASRTAWTEAGSSSPRRGG